MVVVSCEPGLSPLSAALRLSGTPGLAWLDGGLTHGREGRFSFVGAAPVSVVERSLTDGDPFSALDALVFSDAPEDEAPGSRDDGNFFEQSVSNVVLSPGDVPRWIGHLSYDAAWSALRGAMLPRDNALACLRFARYDALFAFDHERELGFLVGDSLAACQALRSRLDAAPGELAVHFEAGPVRVGAPEAHAQRVRDALEQIRAGNVYEVNLARDFRCSFSGNALGLFLRMRELSPVPFGYFAQATDHAVLGRSMERFLRFRASDRRLWTSPIKGTVENRGDAQGEAAHLRADPKEHAEHAMVVDLMRNDLSRVSEAGSVQVRELMAVLPFAGLAHLVSTVESRALPELRLSEIVRGTFPPGSVTGAPKESAMRMIEALEARARGLYTGAVGFVDRAGGCSLAVSIRTAVVRAGEVEYFAGGGIVIGSDPERETEETSLKARVFTQAVHG